MVLGSPCSQELAAGAGSSRRRPRVVQAALRGEAVQAVCWAPRQPFARLAVFCGASRGGADCCSPHFGAPMRCMRRAAGAGVVQDQVGLPFVRGLAYEHTRLRPAVVYGRKTRRSCASSFASVRRRRPALRKNERTAPLQRCVHKGIREQNPPGRATPWLRASSASASWAKAWPAAF